MKYVVIILIISTLFSCKQPAEQENKSPYFEGFVEFSCTYPSKNARLASVLKRIYGQKAITYLGKDGFFSRESIDSNGVIIKREIYRPDSLKFFIIRNGQDTVFEDDVTSDVNSSYMGINRDTSFKILNHRVEVVKAKTVFSEDDTLYVSYYNDVNYNVDPGVYKNVKLGGIETMFIHSPHITTGICMQFLKSPDFVAIATRIVPVNVPSWHFEIPKNKVIIEQKR